MKATQTELARQFLDLHSGPGVFLLPNAWDVSSARIFEDAGFPAIATTSAGIANSLGYADGQKLPRGEMLAVVRRIVESVKVPVTADMMAGYGATPEEVAATVSAVLSSGAVGMNLEDGVDGKPGALVDLNLQKEIVRAAVEASEHAHVPLVLNARTDVFLHAVGPCETRLAGTVERLNAYRDSGAHSLFAPGVTDKQTIAQLVARAEGSAQCAGDDRYAVSLGTGSAGRQACEPRFRTDAGDPGPTVPRGAATARRGRLLIDDRRRHALR